MSAQALDTYLHSIGFDCNVKPQKRRCKKDTNKCQNPDTDRTDIQVAAAQSSNSIGQHDVANKVVTLPAGSNGYAVARFVNDGDSGEDWLKLAPNDTAYWIIEPGNKGVQSRFIEGKTVNGTWTTTLLIGPIEGFGGCGRGGNHDPQAAFADCNSEPYTPGHHPLDVNEDVTSTWISCVAGCCTTQGVSFPMGKESTKKPATKSATKRSRT